jgi:glutamine amidotransferase-like uncharacterized protein
MIKKLVNILFIILLIISSISSINAINVIVYTGNGVSQEHLGAYLQAIIDYNSANDSTHPEKHINLAYAGNINSVDQLNGYGVLLVPGGSSPKYSSGLNPSVIKQFVSTGYGYVGICAGAFYGSSYRTDNAGTMSGIAPHIVTSPWTTMDDVVHITGVSSRSDWNFNMQHRGGPTFSVYSGGEVLANYDNGKGPAIVKDWYGSGSSILFSPHPESQEHNGGVYHPDLLGDALNEVANYGSYDAQKLNKINFDGNYYLNTNLDVKNAGVDPGQHYLIYGEAEGRYPNQKMQNIQFNRKYYWNANQDIRTAGVDPTIHYTQYGLNEGRYANKILEDDQFDRNYYLATNKDVRDAGVDPTEHYMVYGKKEGRQAHG